MTTHPVLVGDCRETMKTLPEKSVQCVITSPPYWGLRDYGVSPLVWGDPSCEHEWGPELAAKVQSTQDRLSLLADKLAPRKNPRNLIAQDYGVNVSQGAWCQLCGAWRGHLGLEPTPDLYVQHLVEVFREVRRVLRDDGTVWLNLGDSYATSPPGNKTIGKSGLHGALEEGTYQKKLLDGYEQQRHRVRQTGLKTKDLVGIPWRVAFALQQDGWYLRQDIIWAKGVSGQKELKQIMAEALRKAHLGPDQVTQVMAHLEPYVGNCMPESVRDRCTRSHEYLFMFSKSPKYFYNSVAVMERSVELDRPQSAKRRDMRMNRGVVSVDGLGQTSKGVDGGLAPTHVMRSGESGRNRRSVWVIPTRPFKGAHFAVFPPHLVEPCLLAGTPEHGVCETCGAPFTRVVRKPDFLSAPKRSSNKVEGQPEDHRIEGSGKLVAIGRGQKWQSWRNANPDVLLGWDPTCQCQADAVPSVVLDPFGGSGTVRAVAEIYGRSSITCELNPDYVALHELRQKDVERALRRDTRGSLLGLRQQTNGRKPRVRRSAALRDDACGGDRNVTSEGHRESEGKRVLSMGDDSAGS